MVQERLQPPMIQKNKIFLFLILSIICILMLSCSKDEKKSTNETTEIKIEKQIDNKEEKIIEQKRIDLPSDLKSELSKGYSLYGVLEQPQYTVVLFAENTNKHSSLIGNFIVAIIMDDKILDYKVVYSNSTYRPIYYDEAKIAIGFFDTTVYKSLIVFFNISEKKIHTIVAKDRYIGELFYHNKYLYYSTEMSDSAIKKIDIDSKKILNLKDFNLVNASFFSKNNVVYACYNEQAFKISDDCIFKTEDVCNYPVDPQKFSDFKDSNIEILKTRLNWDSF